MTTHAPATAQPVWPCTTSGDDELDALGTWVWDVTRRSLTCSEEITDIAQLEPGQLDGNLSWLARLVADAGRRDFCAALLRRADQGAPFEEWIQLTCRDGEMRVLRIKGRPFRDVQGSPLWIVGTLCQVGDDIDITPGASHSEKHDDEQWTEPRDRRSAVGAYRRVNDHLPRTDYLSVTLL